MKTITATNKATIVTPENFFFYLENPELVGDNFEIQNETAIIKMIANREINEEQVAKWRSHCNGMLAMLHTVYYNCKNILALTEKEFAGLETAIPYHDIGKALMPELFSYAGVFSKFQHAAKNFHAAAGELYLQKHPVLGKNKMALRVIKEHHSVSKYYPSQVIKALDVFQSLMAKDATRSYQDPEIAKKAKKIVFEFEKGLHNEKIMNILFDLYEKGSLPVVKQNKVHA